MVTGRSAALEDATDALVPEPGLSLATLWQPAKEAQSKPLSAINKWG